MKISTRFANLTACAVALASSAVAQQKLTLSLDEALEFAKESSITLQQARLEVDNTHADQLSAKGAFLPTISGSVGQTFNSNPINTDPTAHKSKYNGSYGLSLDMTLYNGGENRALLKQSGISTSVANLELEEFENSLEVSITEVYVEILYAIEQISVTEVSLATAEQNYKRGVSFYEAGSLNSAELAQLESAIATYRYDKVVAESQLSNLYVSLKHLLEISQDVTLSIKAPKIDNALLLEAIPSLYEVYDSALESRPEIKATSLVVTSAQLDEQIAKSGYLPTLSLSAGTGLSHNTYDDFTYSAQLRNNFNTSVGLSLSIPIFNGFSTKTTVAKSQNYTKSALFSQTQAQKDLYQTVETLHTNAKTAQAKYEVAEYQLKALEKSLTLITEQYNVGLKNTIELLTEQDNYNQSSQQYLINKYQLILNKALLNYYKTDVIKL